MSIQRVAPHTLASDKEDIMKQYLESSFAFSILIFYTFPKGYRYNLAMILILDDKYS